MSKIVGCSCQIKVGVTLISGNEEIVVTSDNRKNLIERFSLGEKFSVKE